MPATTWGQSLRPALRDDDGPLRPIRPRTPPRPRTVVEPPADEPVSPAPRFRRLGSDPATEEPEGQLAAQPEDGVDASPTGLRLAPRDGEIEPAMEPEPISDGTIETVEEYRNPDGADPVLWDSRPAADSDPFERPAAGYDQQAFTIELDPLVDRRTTQLFRFEPWQPRGIRVGTFTVFPTVDLGAAWLSNVFRGKPARADQALEFRPSVRAVSNWRTHALEVRATGGMSFFDQFSSEDGRAYALEARGRLDVSRRTSVAAGMLRDVTQESRGTLESRLRGGGRADVTTDEARLQIDHRFNRLAVQLRASSQSRTYEERALGDGAGLDSGTTSNRDRNRTAYEETARLAWTFKPTLIGFVEGGINQRRFEAAAADGIRRDSDGERYRVGVGFGNTGQVLRGEASLGYGRQTPLDARLAAVEGIIVDANVTWRVGALTAVLLRASSDVLETSTPLSEGGVSRRIDAEVRHAFMRPLIGTAGISYGSTSYQGISITENVTEMSLGVEYYMGPNAVLFGRYQHGLLRTTAPIGNWDADEVRVGLRLRQ